MTRSFLFPAVAAATLAACPAMATAATRSFYVARDDCAADTGNTTALSVSRVGLSPLPFGSLVDSAIEVAAGAANRRKCAQTSVVRGLITTSYHRLL